MTIVFAPRIQTVHKASMQFALSLLFYEHELGRESHSGT